jgi:hypothetical protein
VLFVNIKRGAATISAGNPAILLPKPTFSAYTENRNTKGGALCRFVPV